MEKYIFQPLNMNGAAASKENAYEKGYLTGYQSWFGIPRKSVVSYDNAGTVWLYYCKFRRYDSIYYVFESSRGCSIIKARKYASLSITTL